ncbi:MAG: D-erythro-7,8-dihydroneopterin triphosphate epimerase [Lentisphaerae bacterium ADurb.BinA184]|nr:MAG: D-erythro-7,8-dihydroneopterin triphosphate epimerase [Lentisphaerae bacterium ADurb.BinA184]
MDTIYIRDLRVRCIIGIRPEERHTPQEVVINLTLGADLRRAGGSDDLKDTVDYQAVKQAVLAHVSASACQLVERLAQEVADICLGFRGVRTVTVTIDKPGALRGARSVAVEFTRTRRRGRG